ELLHHPDYLQRVESAGTTYQSAVQRAALAQANAAGTSVQERARDLYGLLEELAATVRKDWREKRVPVLQDDVSALVRGLKDPSQRRRLFNCAMTGALRRHAGPAEKLEQLLQWTMGTSDVETLRLLDSYTGAFL